MARYLSNVQTNLDRLSKWVVKRISRADNIQADTLAGIVATLPVNEAILLSVYFQVVSSIAIALVCSTIKKASTG